VTVSDVIATISLIVSAMTAGWTIHRDMNDRGKLKVKLMYGDIISGQDIIENQMTVYMTNVGKRDLVLNMVAGEQYATAHKTNNIFLFKIKKLINYLSNYDFANSFFINGNIAHVRIKEGESTQQEIVDLPILETLKSLYVLDSKGNKYFVSDSDIMSALSSYRNIATKKEANSD
jgi:hypothetical protein